MTNAKFFIMGNYKFGDLSLLISNRKVENVAKVIETEYQLKSEHSETTPKPKKTKRKFNDNETNQHDMEIDEPSIKPKNKKHDEKENIKKEKPTELSLEENSSPKKTKKRKNKKNQQENETNMESMENKPKLSLEENQNDSSPKKVKKQKNKKHQPESETNTESMENEPKLSLKENSSPKKVKKRKNKKNQQENETSTESIENEPELSLEENQNDSIPKKVKKLKNKNNQPENETETNTESMENDESETVETKKERKIDPEIQAAINNRTIFVGNWPLKKEKKHLKKYFKQYGTIETVRFRSIPVGDIRITKKVTAITKQFHPDRTSTNAYVQFADEASAKRALAANGSSVDEHHLRVTLSTSNGDHDPKKTIFLGNIHFQAEEDDLWKIFSDCGDLESVKIIRDQKTGISKGTGFVNFKSTDGVELALRMDAVSIKDRPLRIQRVQGKKIKKVKKEKKPKQKYQQQPISNGAAYERRKEKKKPKQFQGVKFTQKLKKKLTKNKPIKRLQKKTRPPVKK